MEIIFSRHARRRMKLYRIEENDVIKAINDHINIELSKKQEIMVQDLSPKYGYPINVVFLKESDKIIIVTVYPVRKERKR